MRNSMEACPIYTMTMRIIKSPIIIKSVALGVFYWVYPFIIRYTSLTSSPKASR